MGRLPLEELPQNFRLPSPPSWISQSKICGIMQLTNIYQISDIKTKINKRQNNNYYTYVI